MKRIYLLLVLFVAFTANSFAQRNIDLQLVSHSVTTSHQFLAGGNKTDTITVTFKNLGPDSIMATDTIWISNNLSTDFFWFKGLKKDSSFTGYFTFNIGATGFTKSETQAINWCDSAYVKAKTTNPAITAETLAMQGNNKICTNAQLTIWKTGINNIDGSGAMNIYPNPASGIVHIAYDFKSSSNASVVMRDMIGKTVYTQALGTNLVGQKEFSLNISSIPAGVYVLELNDNNKKIVNKITVQ